MNTRSFLISFLILITLTIQGCKSRKGPDWDNDSLQRILVDLDNAESLRFSEVFHPPVFVPLETNTRSLIPEIAQIVMKDSIIFIVSDEPPGMIQQFSLSGKYLRTIYNKGRGPDEYLNLYYIDIDDKRDLIVFWEPYIGIVEMDFMGNIIRKIKLPQIVSWGIAIHPSENLYLIETSAGQVMDYSQNQEISFCHFCTFDFNSGILKPWLKRASRTRLVAAPAFSFYNDKVYYQPLIWDTVYLVGNDTVRPVYWFDFGNYTKPEGLDHETDQNKIKEHKSRPGFVSQHLKFYETDEYIISTHEINKDHPILHIVNKGTNNSRVFNNYINDYLGQTAKRSLIRYVRAWFYDNCMITVYQPTELLVSYESLKERMSKSDLTRFNNHYDGLVNLTLRIKTEDNPVLAIYRLK